jgi:hypothetical protein
MSGNDDALSTRFWNANTNNKNISNKMGIVLITILNPESTFLKENTCAKKTERER